MNKLTLYRSKIFLVRGQEVMLDKDVADFYGIDVKSLNKAKSRNEDRFKHDVFRLTKDEYQKILSPLNLTVPKGFLPMAYSKRAAYGISYFLKAEKGMEVSELILDSFIAFTNMQKGIENSQNETAVLNQRVLSLINNLEKGSPLSIQNQFLGAVTLVQGHNNEIKIGNEERIVLELFSLMKNQQVSQNDQIKDLIKIAIEQGSKKDNGGLLDSLNKILSIGSNLTSITTGIPSIIELVKGFLK